MHSKKVLILSYVFPPYPGIGGRRWVKFAKYLCRNGHEVHVVSAANYFNEKSQWSEDVIEGMHVHRLSPRYPKILLSQPTNLLEKLSYRLNLMWMKLTTQGNYYERAAKWERDILGEVKPLIVKEGIKNVIATGGPFYVTYYAAKLKEWNPDLNVIIDFRDQWTSNESFMGYAEIGEKRLAHEKRLEKYAIDNSDFVLTVADYMTESLKSRSTGTANFLTLYNGFDPDDVQVEGVAQDSECIRFVFTGSLYNKLDYVLLPFFEALKQLKKNGVNFEVHFFGFVPSSYHEFSQNNKVFFHGTIPKKQVFKEIERAHFCLLFLNKDHTFSMSTKLFEYLSLKKRIIVCSERGGLMEFIERNKIGRGCEPDTMSYDLLEAVKHFDDEVFNPDFDVDQFSVPVLTKQLEEILV